MVKGEAVMIMLREAAHSIPGPVSVGGGGIGAVAGCTCLCLGCDFSVKSPWVTVLLMGSA